MTTTKLIRSMFAMALLFGTVACDSHDDEDLDEEGCEHLEEGPAVAVTAAADDVSAPAIADDHKRYDIALIDVAGGKGGKVKLEAEAGDHIFFMNADAPLVVKALATGAAVAPEEVAKSSATCAAIKARYVIAFPASGTYVLDFGPTTLTAVGVVIEPHDH